jgi:hypothetical protein
MFSVEVYAKIRRAVLVDGMTRRAASRLFGVHRNTIAKMLAYPVPPGYRRKTPRVSVKLEGFTEHIDAMLESDCSMIGKQRHTCKRVFDRLREEHHYMGGLTIVHEYVRSKRRRMQEVFVPLATARGMRRLILARLMPCWAASACGFIICASISRILMRAL